MSARTATTLEEMMGIALIVDPGLAPTKGTGEWRHGPGLKLEMVFHDEEDRMLFITRFKAAFR